MDAGLGLPLALLIGQQRDRIVFEDGSSKHVKLVGMLYDYVSGQGDGWEEGGVGGGGRSGRGREEWEWRRGRG